jgi:hypothetical protein
MVIEQVDKTTVTQGPEVGAAPEAIRTETQHISRTGPAASEYVRRVIVLVFGLIQLLIGARIVLLLLDARSSNDLVAGVLNASQLFVAPFEGILRTDSLNAGASTLDVAAIVALVGWTILEVILIWAVGIFRRQPA